MNNVLLWIGGLLVALLCALFAVPHFIDWTSYRGVFEEEASRVLGREVRVAGAVNLRLLPTPYVRFEKVRLSDAAGQTGEPFFRADDFTLWLAPGPLLKGAIEAREIELRRPTLKLRLNAAGGGNWQTLSIARGLLPFVPSDVALQSVLITDGTISVDGADGRELLRLGAISGELSVAALEGPFRFKGAADWSGVRHDLRLATTPFEADGALRLKTQVAVPSTGNSYTFDGRIADLSGKVKLDGQIVGQLSFVPAAIGLPTAEAAAVSAARTLIPVDLRAAVAADAGGASLTDIALAFEHDGKPQLVAGMAQIAWQGDVTFKSEFNARWIDLDQLLAAKGGPKPLDALRRLATALPQILPRVGRGQASVSVDQVTLGAESLGDVRLQVERDDTSLRVAEFRINLPGGTRATLAGSLPGGDAFDGEVSLRGANLSRLLNWAGYGAAAADSRTEGAFSLKSKIAFDQHSIAAKDGTASLGNAMLTGGMSYKWADRPRFDIVLEGDEIDLGLVSPRALDLLSHARQLTGSEPASTGPDTAADAVAAVRLVIDPRRQDATLRIRAGRLLDADRDLRDVDVDVAVLSGRLTLRRARFSSGTGLEFDAEGEIADIGTRPIGSLRGTVGAADGAAIAELLELFDQLEDGTTAKRLRALAPARVAWTAKFGDARQSANGSQPVATEFWLDGAALGRRLTAVVRLDNGIRDWRQGNLQLNATIERPDWNRLWRLLATDAAAASARTATAAPATARRRLQFRLSGRPDQLLSTYLKLEDEAFDASIAGRVTLGADAITAADGELQLRTSDAAQALATLGLAAHNLPGIAIEGAADLSFTDKLWKITPSALEVAGAIVGGEVTLARVKDKDRQRLEGRLTVSQASIPRLLDLLVDASAKAAKEPQPQVWQSAAFDLSLLEQIEGRLRMEVAELSLSPDLGLAKGVVEAEFAPGKVDILALEGELLGSRLSSRWTLEKAAAGASLVGTLKAGGLRLDALAPAPNRAGRRLSGTASVTASVSGRGLSPRGLLSALAGKGEIEVGNGGAGALAPLLLRRLSDEIISGAREPTVEAVEQAMLAKLTSTAAEAGLAIGDRKLQFDVADGAVKVRPFVIDTPDGRASNRTTIDLAALMIDSEWKIEQRVAQLSPASQSAKSLGPLPPVTVVFVGPVAALGRLDPVVSVDALVRELAVRRMERDVDELERLRRLDEGRVKAEAERRKAEEEAARAAAAAAAPPVPGAQMPTELPSPPQPGAGQLTPQGASAEPGGVSVPVIEIPPLMVPEQRRRTSSGVTTEPRQIPSSQQLKNQQAQDVFRKREIGGN